LFPFVPTRLLTIMPRAEALKLYSFDVHCMFTLS
jgi:hypothetical protein